MILQELIEELEELEPLIAVFIDKCGVCTEYHEDDSIEFIEEETLNLSVAHYEFNAAKRILEVRVEH